MVFTMCEAAKEYLAANNAKTGVRALPPAITLRSRHLMRGSCARSLQDGSMYEQMMARQAANARTKEEQRVAAEVDAARMCRGLSLLSSAVNLPRCAGGGGQVFRG